MLKLQNGDKPVLQKRNSFRVYFTNPIEGTGKIISVNKKSVTLEKCFSFQILDLSASGIRINTILDFPVDREIVVELTFEFEKEKFVLLGKILRRDRLKRVVEYGIQFLGLLSIDERRLVKCLNSYQVKKIKVQKEQPQKYIVPNSLLKIINILPYPTYLINKERFLIGVNNQAKTKGVILGNKCYEEIFSRKNICPFCRLDEITATKDIIDFEINFGQRKNLASWIYLEKDLYLHYFSL
ncbi:MAG: PilZ domain-containing protein [Zhaonellaceae bacterium]|jgi:hypothetical protein